MSQPFRRNPTPDAAPTHQLGLLLSLAWCRAH